MFLNVTLEIIITTFIVHLSAHSYSGRASLFSNQLLFAIAFHAEGSQKDIQHSRIIKFGNVKTNINGCYNPASSIFTCKDRGLYHFYVVISAYHGRGYGQVWFNIVQDGNTRGQGVTGLGEDGPVGSIFAMIRCYPGSHIWVRQRGDAHHFKQAMWVEHSQFGGFKIAK